MKTYVFFSQEAGKPPTGKNHDFATDEGAVTAAKADQNVFKVVAHDGSVVLFEKEPNA